MYLLENGNLLRTATIKAEFSAKGGAGRIEEFSWEGELLWSFEYSNDKVYFHHDIERLPNGNTLVVAWERIDAKDVLAAGSNPKLMPDPEQDETLWMDHLIEVNKKGEIVWEWHIADHLIQDFDANRENFVVVAEHPERININYLGGMKASNDWNHVNAVDYNPELDQIMMSSRTFSEIWIIDHNTTTAEAATDKGNLLYRWGNPAAYDRGDVSDQQFFGQHDAKWLTDDLPGAGHILAFNNGDKKLRNYSSVEEIIPPEKRTTMKSSMFPPEISTGTRWPIWLRKPVDIWPASPVRKRIPSYLTS